MYFYPHMVTTSSIAEIVARHELFRGFSNEHIAFIIAQSKIRELHPGEILIHYGKENHYLFLLIDGELRVILGKDGTQVSIPIHPGECLGEMSLVIGSPTSAMAVSHTVSRVLVITEDMFWSHLAVSRQGVKNLLGIMAERLHRNNQALIKEIEEQLKYKQLEKDLETAGKIQAKIVPDGTNLFPNRPQVEVYAYMKQAREVGGDFYDALALDQDHIYFAIGDATGKGMPAALFMMQTFTSLRFLVSNYPQFADVVPALNSMLAKKNDDMMFVSLWAGILNVKTGVLQYVNGGHNPPFTALGGDNFQLLNTPHGPLVGVMDEAKFEVNLLKMEPGDTIFLYTDGLSEAFDPDQTAFETARIEKSLNSFDRTSMYSLVHDMEVSVENFVNGAPAHDDMTMLAFRYWGNVPD
jgi:phosphoserine phosphatase RsbU/P